MVIKPEQTLIDLFLSDFNHINLVINYTGIYIESIDKICTGFPVSPFVIV
jgi:hypothetical protein